MTPAYIALGSNLQDPHHQLCAAVSALQNLPESQVDALSSFYRSPAVGPGTQPDYLNAVLRLRTALQPLVLLRKMQAIEAQQGRVRLEQWGPRTLDLDLLLFGDITMDNSTLTIPHPRMHERDFVLYPLQEISDTNLILPNGTDLNTLIQRCPGNNLVKTDYHVEAR